MAPSRIGSQLVAMSSAAIVAVYAAGFVRTRAAAERLEASSRERRPSLPAPATAGETTPEVVVEPPPPAANPNPSAPVAKSPAVVVNVPSSAGTDVKTPSAPGSAAAPVAPPAKPAASAAVATPITSAAHDVPAATASAGTHETTVAPTVAPTVATAAPAPTAAVTADVPPAAAVKAEETPHPPSVLMPKEHYKDGTYLGWGTSRHGDIQASVTIERGRITAAVISQCLTRYSCSVISPLPPQVVARQSQEVDYVSGATQSANAFYYAVVDALAKAK